MTHWGAYRVEARNGRVIAVHADPDDPAPSPIGRSLVDVERCRVARPSIRAGWLHEGAGPAKGARGNEPFVEVDWDVAIGLVAAELERVRSDHGNEAIYAGSYGWASPGRFHHAQSQIHRFMNTIGGYSRSVNTYSVAAAEVIVPHVVGHDWWQFERMLTSWPVVEKHTELLVAFGGIPAKNSQVAGGGIARHEVPGWLERCSMAGIEMINVSPIGDDLDGLTRWLAPRPGSDVAVMLGILHTLIVDELVDLEFLHRYCTGWADVRAYVLGERDGVPKTPTWAGELSGLDATTMESLAHEMNAKRTMVTASWSIQRADHGEHAIWMLITLASALGQIGLPGGGFAVGYGAEATIGNGLAGGWMPGLPQGANAVDRFIPVARIADMLLDPGGEFEYNGATFTYPDTKLVYWAGGNPFHHHQDLNKLRAAFQTPDTVIVHEPFWTATAKHADIVLPVTTSLERNDIGGAATDRLAVAMPRSIAPIGEALDDYEVFARLADRLGTGHKFTEGRTSDEWVRHIYDQLQRSVPSAPSFDEFWPHGRIERPVAAGAAVQTAFAEFRANPDGRPLPTPSGRIELYSNVIAAFGAPDHPGHAAWNEPREWLGRPPDNTSLHLISNQPRHRLHSQWDHGITSRESKVADREPVRIHPVDAAKRGIRNGDVVMIRNARGACLAGVFVSDRVRRGVVELATGAWYDPDPDGTCRHGNPNVLTADIGTSDLTQGSSAQTCMVEVSRCDDPPPHQAWEPPPFTTC